MSGSFAEFMPLSQQSFFETNDRSDGSLEIRFLTKSLGKFSAGGRQSNDRINILPARYEEFRRLAGQMNGREVVVTGRGPIEGYFAVGYYATLFNAKKVIYEGANGTPRLEMPATETLPADKPWLDIEHQNGAITVSVVKSPSSDGKWDAHEIKYSVPPRLPVTSQCVTFTGSGAVSMYLLLGASAARAGLKKVCVAKPAIPYAVLFTPDHAGETISLANEKKGVVVGIIGDPNSGKSVFSRAFYMSLRSSMPRWFQSWIYDCDLASPTPDWYCTALVNADSKSVEDYKALRDSQKVTWNENLEKHCADDLGILRTNLDLVIADLPGGRHKDDNGQPLLHPVRIGREARANMFRQCDAFILLCRKDRHDEILKGWVDALTEFGLEDRLMAVLDSAEPNADFSVSPLVTDADGILCGEIHGLNREHPAGETGQNLIGPIRPLVRALSAIPVINAARAAAVTAFLTSNKGTRYGAAVRSVSTGRIFAAGQYSSFNHSTNMHAEMNVLAQAAIAGEPDVDILAITSTSSDMASPCGVCRQVITEHATRTGRDFDVVLTRPTSRPVIIPVSGLLPHAWHAHCTDAATDIRDFPEVSSVFNERTLPRIGSELIAPPLHCGEPSRMALVWDDAFMAGTVLFKFKYEQIPDGRWLKLPHAFTESADYLRYLADNRCGSATFNGLSMLKIPVGNTPNFLFKHPVPLVGDMLRLMSDSLFSTVGIDTLKSVSVTGSRMTGIAKADSDWDLYVAATSEQINRLRTRIVVLAAEGRVTFSEKSRSWKFIKDIFPGAAADGGACVHAEGRYADSFRLDGIPISLLFVHPDSEPQTFAFPSTFTTSGRAVISGRVIDASHAPYKRSESVVETSDRRRVRILCYHKMANLLKNDDRIAASGVRCLHPDREIMGCRETLVLSAPAVDKLIWLP